MYLGFMAVLLVPPGRAARGFCQLSPAGVVVKSLA